MTLSEDDKRRIEEEEYRAQVKAKFASDGHLNSLPPESIGTNTTIESVSNTVHKNQAHSNRATIAFVFGICFLFGLIGVNSLRDREPQQILKIPELNTDAELEQERIAKVEEVKKKAPELIAAGKFNEVWLMTRNLSDASLDPYREEARKKVAEEKEEELKKTPPNELDKIASLSNDIAVLRPDNQADKLRAREASERNLAFIKEENERKAVEREKILNAELKNIPLNELEKVASKANELALLRPENRTYQQKAKVANEKYLAFVKEENERKANEERRANAVLEVQSWNWSNSYGHAIASGQVKNLTSEPLKSVQAVVSFYDKDENFITSNDSMLEYQPLLPGQTSPFKVYATWNPAMRKAQVEFKRMFGGTLKSVEKEKKVKKK